jgi:hypothetical protein
MFQKLTRGIILIVCVLNFSGCFFLILPAVGLVAGAGIGIGTAKWMSDKLVEQVPYSYQHSIEGARAGVKSLNLEVIKETASDKLTQISCKYPDGRTVWINIVLVSDKLCRLEVRVGSWGGKEEASKILDAIMSNLK